MQNNLKHKICLFSLLASLEFIDFLDGRTESGGPYNNTMPMVQVPNDSQPQVLVEGLESGATAINFAVKK
ncbi:hypothetical protein PV328_007065 [Microctonus aethiopoides]|uniref:Uncharacterized protein n=1 Tax=Microctonus aethiopoides TaxID=144406 RepID=A0AA39FRA3_9HYME|nr:hypothetical protein PV328_007065 [Microctonus aethiopoides]